MNQSNYFEGIGDTLVKVVSEVLKDDYSSCSDLSFESAQECCVYFVVDGDINGEICVSFSGPEEVSRQFLMVTVGDSEAASVNEACQEIANQIVGRILGTLNENGADVAITYPGTVGEIKGGEKPLTACSGKYGSILVSFLSIGADMPAETVPEEQEVEEAGEQSKNKPRVLIVDDSPVMCAFLEKIFLENGYEVAGKAADGVEALEMFERTDPDVVTLDIVMPKLKGTEVLQKILKIRPDAAVVMASSVSDAKTVMNCLKMGAKRYIIKPYDRKAVIGAVEKALGFNMGG